MIDLLVTAGSLDQAKSLLDAGADKVIVGEECFGLRLPGYLSWTEIASLALVAHAAGKEIIVAANAILHNDKIIQVDSFVDQALEAGIDLLLVGDTGFIQCLKKRDYPLPYIYDAGVLVTSPGQVNFWAKYGAVASLVAREVPRYELAAMQAQAQIPLIYQVYGPTCIHQSKRKLLTNYFNYTDRDPQDFLDRPLSLSEPNKDHTHYAIYEDSHGTHIFANDDLNLMDYLDDLAELGVRQWYLDGLFTDTDSLVQVVSYFSQARDLIQSQEWTSSQTHRLNQLVVEAHPKHRSLGTGFYLHEPGTVQ